MAAASGSSSNLSPLDLSQSKPSLFPTTPTGSHPLYQLTTSPSFITLGALHAQHSPLPVTPLSDSLSSSVLDPPPGTAFADFLQTWCDDHVAQWLTDIKCGAHIETFKNMDIRGDILLELDQDALKEIGIASLGDRLRIVNGVKDLRSRCPSWNTSPLASTTLHAPVFTTSLDSYPFEGLPRADGTSQSHSRVRSLDISGDSSPASRTHRRLRPAPLVFSPSLRCSDLPGILREPQPGDPIPNAPTIRPLSQTGPLTPHNYVTTRTSLPLSPASTRGRLRTFHPLIVPRTRTPNQFGTDSSTESPLSPAPTSAGSSTNGWSSSSFGLPASPRSPPSLIRSPTPWGLQPSPRANLHNTNSACNDVPSPLALAPVDAALAPRPSISGASTHSYISTQMPTSHSWQTSRARSEVGHHPLSSATRRLSLDDLRRKLIKFVMPEEGRSYVIDITDCHSGVGVMEKVLKKVEKSRLRRDSLVENVGGLCVDGWSVYLVWDEINRSGDPLTEAELLAVCRGSSVHYDPVKERGLILRKSGQTERTEGIDIHQTHGESPTQPISLTCPLPPLGPSESDGLPDAGKPLTTCPKSTDESKVRAIEVGTSIFSVHDPEKRDSPKQDQQENPSADSSKGSPKLRNSLHQRLPNELISTHLTEHLPLREQKVLRKARPRDMSSCSPSRGRSDSRITASRFSKGSNASRPAQRSKLSVTLVKLWKSVKGFQM